MKALMLAAALALAAGPGPSAQADDVSSPDLRIAYEAFKHLYDAQQVLVIDTRDRASYDMGHIPRARSIPADDIPKHIRELRRETRAIVTYCS